ncbi:MAG: zinc ABC transporter substrate-binding protein [Caldilineaceae bacterium]|nr:zinc ABC transporter substrate-binding protein [Caldilineaceae bacterium]
MYVLILAIALPALAGCGAAPAGSPANQPPAGNAAGSERSQDPSPALTPVTLQDGEKLRVVATTNVVADIVRQVGGDDIELVSLLPPGADPHSYQATPDDLRRLNQAHVIFINGLRLEEAMVSILENLDQPVPIVSVNRTVTPRVLDEGVAGARDHGNADPHTWMDVGNVVQWVATIAETLTGLDPAHGSTYTAAAASYQETLAALDSEIRTAMAAIPAGQRKLVSDHDSLGYFANAYGLEIIGTVVPSLSTMASPSAQELAALQRQIEQEKARAILVESTVNPNLAQQLAQDTGARVVVIYSGSLSDAQGPAPTYVEMMRYDAQAIARALGSPVD